RVRPQGTRPAELPVVALRGLDRGARPAWTARRRAAISAGGRSLPAGLFAGVRARDAPVQLSRHDVPVLRGPGQSAGAVSVRRWHAVPGVSLTVTRASPRRKGAIGRRHLSDRFHRAAPGAMEKVRKHSQGADLPELFMRLARRFLA